MKVVKVLWVDSCNSNMNWTIAEDIEIEPMYIDSFGVVVKDTNEFLAIAQNYGDNPEQYSNITTIPKGCIKEVFVIHEDNVCENEQNPTEWGEEDEKTLNSILSCIKHCQDEDIEARYNGNRYIDPNRYELMSDWLKSIRPQNRWKPSDEQMEALDEYVYAKYPNTEKYGETIISLVEQLKKLREE